MNSWHTKKKDKMGGAHDIVWCFQSDRKIITSLLLWYLVLSYTLSGQYLIAVARISGIPYHGFPSAYILRWTSLSVFPFLQLPTNTHTGTHCQLWKFKGIKYQDCTSMTQGQWKGDSVAWPVATCNSYLSGKFTINRDWKAVNGLIKDYWVNVLT
jgi:hypothetical protein